ncbi:MAG: prolyl oligopeptidase family serine peptidase [Polyangiales bacterium]
MKRLIAITPFIAWACASSPTEVDSSRARPTQAALAAADDDAGVEDPYLWLEEVESDRSLAWVSEQNARSLQVLENDEQSALQERLLGIYDSQDRIAFASKRGAYLYNFWQDEAHVRGIWRRTTLEEYKKPQPSWQTVLDLDALALAENENWVYSGATWLQPTYDRVLVSLSRGGGDAVVVREYDVEGQVFVADGFSLPEAKSDVAWKDANTLFVGTDFGPDSLTTSGYPRIVKEWTRGTPLTEAKTVYEGLAEDVGVFAARDWHQGRATDVITRWVTFYDSESYLLNGDQAVLLEKPLDADVGFFGDFVLFRTRSDWTQYGQTFPRGALLAAPLAEYQSGQAQLSAIYTPTATSSLQTWTSTKNALLLNVLDDVRTKVIAVRREGETWTQTEQPSVGFSTVETTPYDPDAGDQYWITSEDFISPVTLSIGDLSGEPAEVIRTAPTFFDATGLEVTQHFATSKDGTRVPYFQVAKQAVALDGNNPTLLYGYGGFEISLTPAYSATTGVAWLEKGGVFVQANIRGGGEYGPAWHEAALKQNRQRAYDDFIAVGEDLIKRQVTQPARLGIEGGSNGGLLTGVAFTQRPDLWGAVVSSVPLLDMKRYHLLLAGASWIGEYGDPDNPEEWAAIAAYSPYQNVKPDVHYPRVLFTTSTLDDRVHPGHARKMVARLLEQGHDVLYFENTEGGHAGAANNAQRARVTSLEYSYLYQQLTQQ